MEKIKFGPSTYLYPKPAVLVGALVDEKPNFMTCNTTPGYGHEVGLSVDIGTYQQGGLRI